MPHYEIHKSRTQKQCVVFLLEGACNYIYLKLNLEQLEEKKLMGNLHEHKMLVIKN